MELVFNVTADLEILVRVTTPASPLRIPGCVLWARASRAGSQWQDAARTTLVTADDQPIGCWDDLSGNEHHLPQSGAGSRPLWKQNILNGRAVVRFDGANDFLRALNFPWVLPMTVFIVVKLRVSQINGYIYDGGTANSMAASERPGAGDFSIISGGNTEPTVALGTGNFGIICAIYGWGGQGEKRLRLNNGVALSHLAGVQDANGFVLGTYFGADALFSAIDVAEVIGFQGALNDEHEQYIRDMLNEEYAIF